VKFIILEGIATDPKTRSKPSLVLVPVAAEQLRSAGLLLVERILPLGSLFPVPDRDGGARGKSRRAAPLGLGTPAEAQARCPRQT